MRQMDTQQVSKLKQLGLGMPARRRGQRTRPRNDRDKAKRIHDRIAGVPPTEADARPDGSAGRQRRRHRRGATSPRRTPSFYNVTLKNMAVPWTNRDQTVFAPLNDYVATFIGMVRDDVPFNTALSADLTYTVNGVTPAASPSNNDHYANAETNDGRTCMTALHATTQSSVLGIPADGHRGLHHLARRRRRRSSSTAPTARCSASRMINHMCRDMEQVHDTSLPPDMIRQDVSRSPGGDSRIFLNNCIGCHSGMDPMARAFAYYDFDNGTADAPGTMRLVYTRRRRAAEVLQQRHQLRARLRHAGRPLGEPLAQGPELAARLGHGSLPGKGTGAKSMGQELANSDAFAQCQVEKVFKTVCFRAPGNAADRAGRHQRDGGVQGERLRLKDSVRAGRRPPRTAWASEGDTQ